MFQVLNSYLFTYHSKASKGIALVAKIGENLVRTCQSQGEKVFENVKSQREIWLQPPSKKADFWLVATCCK
jgi:hypothetical protein